MGRTINTGPETWLNKCGVTVNNNFVVDASAIIIMANYPEELHLVNSIFITFGIPY